MKINVFIDGAEGTTGLKIHEYFARREDIRVLEIDRNKRKDPEARLGKMKEADVSFLCLPDQAAEEIARACPGDCRLIDTSTAHRTDEGWVYGLPELAPEQRDRIRGSCRIANPGCHATGAILLLRPLIDAGVIGEGDHMDITSLTGYSGGGRKMIADYENPARPARDRRSSPGLYGLGQKHKHIPEIMKMTGLTLRPAFLPIVADYYSGMAVIIPLAGEKADQAGDRLKEKIPEIYRRRYGQEAMITVKEGPTDEGFLYGNRLTGTDGLEISVQGDGENILLTAAYDNLGKGASGAAVQNMNLMLGIEETRGLKV